MATSDGAGRRFRPGLWPTLTTVPAVLVLLGLGGWQLQRLAWKEGLIAERAAGLAAAPLVVRSAADMKDGLEFRRVKLTGSFVHDGEMVVLSRTYRGQAGAHVVTPLRLARGGHVVVDRGWVPMGRIAAETRAGGQVRGAVEVVGIVRRGGRANSWTPDNLPGSGVWYYLDPPAMAASAGLGPVPEFFVEAGPAPNPGGYPLGGQTRVSLVNNHLLYALIWFALAAAAVAIYVLYHLQQRRTREQPR